MNDAFTLETLKELINSVQAATPHNKCLIFTPNIWMYELKRNPQYFYCNDQGELLYAGYKVEAIITLSDDGTRFWSMADEMIKKKENHK